MDLQIAIVLLVIASLEGVHASLAQEIKKVNPELSSVLGGTAPGYYFFGHFWFSPTYRKFLTSGKLASELLSHPTLVLLSRIEQILWYAMWATIAVAVFGIGK